MFKTKYQFNSETLSYDKIELTLKEKIIKVLLFILAFGASISLISFIIFKIFIDSTSYRTMQREKKQLVSQYQTLNERVEQLTAVLQDLQQRDESLYRLTYNAAPLPSSVRDAGFGGSDRYKDLKGYENSELIISTTERLDKLARRLVVQSKSYDELIALAKAREKKMRHIPALIPVDKKYSFVASAFGYRKHPILGIVRMHEGVDMDAPRGAKVYATGDGVVVGARYNGGYGRVVSIKHGYGYETRYAHLQKMLVRKGQKVKRGDVIGLVGNSGLSTSSHLHYEVRVNGKPVNPINYYFSDISPSEYVKMHQAAGPVKLD